jgi:hypothetical protein
MAKATVEAVVRKIIESTLISADGVVGDPQGWAMQHREGQKKPLKFVGAKTFGTGVAVLTYEPQES